MKAFVQRGWDRAYRLNVWRVKINHGVQTFTLDYDPPTKAEAQWMVDQFTKALARHDEEKRNEQGPIRSRRIRSKKR